jgi:hypothetical protein
MNFDDFGDETPTWPSFKMNDDIHGVSDIGLDGAKANVNPETTMATSDNPRAIVLVKACCSTFTAFSHGEFPCAKAGTASARVIAAIPNPRASNRKPRTNREHRFMEEAPSEIKRTETRVPVPAVPEWIANHAVHGCREHETAQTSKTASAVSLTRHARRELVLHVPISVSDEEFCVAQNE